MTAQEREEIILSNKPLVLNIAKKYAIVTHTCAVIDFDDLIQEGEVAIIKAVDCFDPTLGFKFSTIAYPYISGDIQRFIDMNVSQWHRPRGPQGYYPIPVETSMDAPRPGNSDENDMSNEEGAEDEAYNLLECKILIEQIANSKEEARACMASIFEGRTQNEIAAELNVSQVQVSRLINRTLNRVRKEKTKRSKCKTKSKLKGD